MIETREFRSKSNPGRKPDQLRFNRATGEIIWCECPAFKNTKTATRTCPHAREVIAEFTSPQDDDEPTPPAPATPVRPVENLVRVKPMLASAMDKSDPTDTIERYANDRHVLETKYDGDCVMVRKNGRVSAWSRPQAGKEPNGRELPQDITEAFEALPDGLYHGELMLPGTTSKKGSWRGVVVFDALEIIGQSITHLDYVTRRSYVALAVDHHLKIALANGEPVLLKLPDQYPVSREVVERLWAAGEEGGVIKRKASTYQPGFRTKDWIKVKQLHHMTVTIIGFEYGRTGSQKQNPYAVTQIRRHDGGKDTTVSTKDNATMRDIAKDQSRYIGRDLVIYFTEFTESGNLRHAGWDYLAKEA